METVIDRPVFPAVIHADEVISVDLGLKVFGMFGNAKETFTVPNPRWIKVHAKRLRRFQQSLSRKQYDHNTHKGSKNWEKAIASVGWSQFLTIVKCKMEKAGKYFRKMSRWFPSSQTCRCCQR